MAFLAPLAVPLIGGAATLAGSLIGRNSAPDYQQAPPPPKMEDMMDVIDNVNGVQSITRKGVGGKSQRVIERLPRTREEEMLYNEYGRLMAESMRNIQNLSAIDPNAALNFAPYVNAVRGLNEERAADIARLVQMPDFQQFTQQFRDMEQTAIREQYRDLRNSKQSQLAGMGYGMDSTAWANVDAAINAEEAKAMRGLDVRAQQVGQEFAKGELQNRILGYNLGEEARGGRRQAALDVLGAEREQLAERELNREKRMQEQAGVFKVAAGMRGEDQTKAMQSVAPQLGQDLYRQQLLAHQVATDTARYNQLNRPPNIGEMAGNALGSMGGSIIGEGSKGFGKAISNFFTPTSAPAPMAGSTISNPNYQIGRYNMGFTDWLPTQRSGNAFSQYSFNP
jgi:hypothetical protein